MSANFERDIASLPSDEFFGCICAVPRCAPASHDGAPGKLYCSAKRVSILRPSALERIGEYNAPAAPGEVVARVPPLLRQPVTAPCPNPPPPRASRPMPRPVRPWKNGKPRASAVFDQMRAVAESDGLAGRARRAVDRNLELSAQRSIDGHVFALSHAFRNLAIASSRVAAVPCVARECRPD
jgi:hypothetical protein